MYERLEDDDTSGRKSGRCLFLVVPCRTAMTLLNVINKHIAEGTRVHSDCWRSYNKISVLKGLRGKKYEHRTVNHDKYFVDPDREGSHTKPKNCKGRAKNGIKLYHTIGARSDQSFDCSPTRKTKKTAGSTTGVKE